MIQILTSGNNQLKAYKCVMSYVRKSNPKYFRCQLLQNSNLCNNKTTCFIQENKNYKWSQIFPANHCDPHPPFPNIIKWDRYPFPTISVPLPSTLILESIILDKQAIGFPATFWVAGSAHGTPAASQIMSCSLQCLSGYSRLISNHYTPLSIIYH